MQTEEQLMVANLCDSNQHNKWKVIPESYLNNTNDAPFQFLKPFNRYHSLLKAKISFLYLNGERKICLKNVT